MNTGRFFLAACASTTSVQCTLVSIVRTGLSTISLHADGGREVEDGVGLVDQLGDQRLLAHESIVYSKRGSSRRWRMFVDRAGREVVERVDGWPRASSSSARCEPMNPAPPVIRNLMSVGDSRAKAITLMKCRYGLTGLNY